MIAYPIASCFSENPGPLVAGEYACACPACRQCREIAAIFDDAARLADHNLWTICDSMRQVRSAALMKELKEYLEVERPNHLPKGPMGKAISYAIENWNVLSLFLSDPKLRLDNNISERQLRLIALGRFYLTASKTSRRSLD